MFLDDRKLGKRLSVDFLTRDFFIGIVFLITSAVFIFYIAPVFIEDVSYIKNEIMSPSWLPIMVSWIVFVLSFLICLSEIFKKYKPKPKAELERSSHIYTFILVVVGYYMAFEYFGAALTSVIATIILFYIRGVRSIPSFLIAIFIPISVYFFFTELLNVPLPIGFF